MRIAFGPRKRLAIVSKPSLVRGVLGILLVAFAFSFRSKLQTSSENSTNSDETKRDPVVQGNDREEPTNSSGGSELVKVEPSQFPPHQYDDNDERRDRYSRWMFWIQLATLIAVVAYACVTRKQLRDFEKVQSARLVVAEHNTVMDMTTNDAQIIARITGAVTIRNAGGSVANDINYEEMGCGWSLENPTGTMRVKINPKPGNGLAPQDTQVHPIRCGESENPKGIEGFYSHIASISYRDIWGEAFAITTCKVYRLKKPKGWFDCDLNYSYYK